MTAYGVIKDAGIWQDVLDIMNGGRHQDYEIAHLRRNLKDQSKKHLLTWDEQDLLAALYDGSFNPADEYSRCKWAAFAETVRSKLLP